jgi:hypothetical protein
LQEEITFNEQIIEELIEVPEPPTKEEEYLLRGQYRGRRITRRNCISRNYWTATCSGRSPVHYRSSKSQASITNRKDEK